MYARFVAFVCLSSFGLCSHLPEPLAPTLPTLFVFLKGTQSQSPDTLREMRREVQQLMADTFKVEFRTPQDLEPISGRLVVMELKGVCGESGPEAKVANGDDLATTSVADGHVQPFSKVNCSTVSALLAPALVAVPAEQRPALIGRSLGRVMAHELYHIVADETRHVHAGVAKSSFSSVELLSASFTFEESALDRMADRPSVVAEVGLATGPVLKDSDER